MVTLIESIANATGGHQTNMTTFTGIASDDYYNEINQYIPIPVVGSSELKVTIPNRVNYNIATVYVKGPVDLKSYNDGETLDLNYGLTGDNDLFVLLEKIDPRFYRYLYTPDVQPGEVTITPEDFETLPEVDAHTLVYPDHATRMDYSYGIVNGVVGVAGTPLQSTYALDVTQWESDEQPVLRYPDIDNLFGKYETIVVGVGQHGESYITDIVGPAPTTNIVNLTANLVSHDEITTKRISVDFTGNARIIFISDNFGPAENNVQWDIYTPMTSKLRINLPQFGDDILKELPALAETKDQAFDQLSVDDYDMSYEEFYKTILKGNFYFRPDKLRATNFVIDNSGNGRRTVDVNAVLKRHRINAPPLQ
jgi:hypothetical protein